MCISGLARNINDWKLTGRKKKEVMKTTSHSERHQWCCHIFHSSCIHWWLATYHVVFSSFIRAAVQCIDRSRAISWYGLLMSFPVAGLGLVPLLIYWLCASISVSRTHPNHVKGYRMLGKNLWKWKSVPPLLITQITNLMAGSSFTYETAVLKFPYYRFGHKSKSVWRNISWKGLTTQYVLVPLWVM